MQQLDPEEQNILAKITRLKRQLDIERQREVKAVGWDLSFQDNSATATADASSTCTTWGDLFPPACALQRIPIDSTRRFVADETIDPPHEFTVLLSTHMVQVVHAVAIVWFTGSYPVSYSLQVESNG